MKPRTQPHDDKKTQTAPPAPKAPAEPAAGAGGKRKQPSGASAGRKIARKTAHSIIERRRREKMNEEFRVLKDMVPACAGQEMHKLAILQVIGNPRFACCARETEKLMKVRLISRAKKASIEYMQYLQSCVNSFSSSSSSSRGPHSIGVVEARPSPCSQRATDAASDEEMDDDDNDDNNDDDDNDDNTTDDHKPPHHKHPDPPTLPSPSATSPATSPRFPSLSSHTPSSPDTTTQPQSRFLPLPASHFSPVLYPQQQAQQADVLTAIDHEASTALLMLNANDRRSTSTSASAASVSSRGMSVKDLLRG